MAKLDFDGLKARLHGNILGYVQAWLPGGRREGHEYVTLNPIRPDAKKGSFKVNLKKGYWSDFAAGPDARGKDLISLYAYLKGISQGDAYKELNGPWDGGNVVALDPKVRTQVSKAKQVPDETFTPLPLPDDAPAMPAVKGKPERVHLFHDENGRAVLREVIYRPQKGGKNKIPVPTSWGRHVYPKMRELENGSEEWTGELIDVTGWCKKNWPENRPPYNLHHLAARPQATVYIAEGAKKADRLAAVLGDSVVAMGWIGGANGLLKTDWASLIDRHVVLWPDYDLPGQKAMLELGAILRKQGCTVELVWEPLEEARHPEHWDVADEADDARVKDYLAGALGLDVVEKLVEEGEKIDGKRSAAGKHGGMADSVPAEVLRNQRELRCMGYSGDNKVYFISRKRGVMVALAPDQLGNLSYLLTLMPLDFWYDLFPDKKGGIDKHKCSDTLQRWADLVGYFNPDVIRGSGVWREANGDLVFHLGQKLLVGQKLVPINEYKSEFMYEATKDLGVKFAKPLDTARARQLLTICEHLDWEVPVYAKLLAGFCVVAPMCGGLDWRPHVWVTGSAGSGKSTVMKEIVRRVCGRICLFVQGDSTSAGIRQRLGSDALPVLFDEIEGETQARLLELGKVLDLARQASSETGAMMLKGGAMGEAIEFMVRSCFAFSAINVNVAMAADKSRITVLSLKEPPKGLDEAARDKRFQGFEAYIAELHATLTDEYVNELHMRAYALLPIIRANAKVFGQAINAKLNNRRLGDQLGTLAAGCYALESTKVATIEEAKAWVNAQDWESTVPLDDMKDHDRCLSYVLQARVKFQGERAVLERTLGELVEEMMRATTIDVTEHIRVLGTHGLKVDQPRKVLQVANNHTALERLFKDTPYRAWSRLLLRIEGAKSSNATVRFTGNQVSRAVEIPLELAARPDVKRALPAREGEDEMAIPF